MRHSYTPDDLLLFIYNEVDELERFKILQALEVDQEFNQIYQMLKKAVSNLDALVYEPNPTSVEIVLEHSHHEEHFH